jgi:magnesium chelatase family protein
LIRNFDNDPNTADADADFGDIAGQENAKRAVIIAAAGRHGLLMIGSPGCGKSMIAGRMGGIMPLMNEREVLETAIVRSVSGHSDESRNLLLSRPFRSPHHTIGRAGLIGGGAYPVPGEITLAHNGVLFLDEICEFSRDTIESLRIPMEEKKITHFRRGEAYSFPCNFQVVMAANPCPCGYLGDRDRECTCTQADLDRYRRKLSGPIIDRIDMRISMEKVSYDVLSGQRSGMDSAEMRDHVERAISFAKARGQKVFNSEIADCDIEKYCRLGEDENRFMKKAYDAFGMSPRAYSRTVKVARSIADLDSSKDIGQVHLAEALNYRIQE